MLVSLKNTCANMFRTTSTELYCTSVRDQVSKLNFDSTIFLTIVPLQQEPTVIFREHFVEDYFFS